MRPSVVGLGTMGTPIARNLAAAGLPVTVYGRSAASRAPFAGVATVAASAREAVVGSDVALLVVPSEAELDEVLERTAAGVGYRLDGTVVATMATVAPAYSERLAADVAAAGGRYVEAPMSGSKRPAEAGTLVLLAAGDDDVLDQLDPVFDVVAKSVVRCGAPPAAMRMKLANNLLLVALIEALTESVHLAERMGLGAEAFLDVVLAGPIASDVVRVKAPKLLARDLAAEAPLKHVAKDLRLIAAEAARVGAATPVAATLRELFDRAAGDGLAECDITAVVRLLEADADR